jgi:hypothetical protein
MTSRKSEGFEKEDGFLWFVFLYIQNFMYKLLLKLKFVNQIFFCWTIKSFICALIPQHNDRLGNKSLSIINFHHKIFFKYPSWCIKLGQVLKRYQIVTIFVYTITCIHHFQGLIGHINVKFEFTPSYDS